MEMVEGGTRAEVASGSKREAARRVLRPRRDAGSTFSASPFIHARSGEARHRSGAG